MKIAVGQIKDGTYDDKPMFENKNVSQFLGKNNQPSDNKKPPFNLNLSQILSKHNGDDGELSGDDDGYGEPKELPKKGKEGGGGKDGDLDSSAME